MFKCRNCQTNANIINRFGKMPVANAFLDETAFNNEYFFQLSTAFCCACKTFQLVEQPDSKLMFHDEYAFFSSTSTRMAEHFYKMACVFESKYLVDRSKAFVVELGSNDGIMLKHFAQKGIRHLGVEPSGNVAKEAQKQGVNTVCDFFNDKLASKISKEYGNADIICASNVMCHIPDLHSVGKGVKTLLKETGVFIFEDPYLGAMLNKVAYDQIYDEHVYIFSLTSVQNIFSSYGLEVFHVEPQETHGGSMRYYLCQKGQKSVQSSVKAQFSIEKKLGLDSLDVYLEFNEKCERNKKSLVQLLESLKSQGKRVVGYAATSKSTTILNYCNIGPDLIEYICDITPIKQHKYSPGMHIPIQPYEVFHDSKPDCAVLFAWNHMREILEKETNFSNNGGKWIIFHPEIQMLDLIKEPIDVN